MNSKRLWREQLEWLARALQLPTSVSGDEMQQMIDGKLSDGGKQTPNVQVVMGDTDPGVEMGLED